MPVPESLTDHLPGSAHEALAALETLTGRLVPPVRAVSFWVAALLPFTYLPLLVSGAVADHLAAFLALLCVNAVAFVLGHGHRRADAPRRA